MLTINVKMDELFDDDKQEFIPAVDIEIILEHSLISISKWEAIYKKPFLSAVDKTDEETTMYIQCMTINKKVESYVYNLISHEDLVKISDYIADSMTATTISNTDNKPNREIITSELVYYWMVAYNIPFECEKWHFNRLMTLINICSIKNEPPKKRSAKDIAASNSALNAKRRAEMASKG